MSNFLEALTDQADDGLADVYLFDWTDDTRLTPTQIRSGWGSAGNFCRAHGLDPTLEEDCREALAISR